MSRYSVLPSNHRGARARPQRVGLLALLLCLSTIGCASMPRNDVQEVLEPSNHRNWKANMAILPYARIHGDKATIHNIRNCTYLDEDAYVLDYYDRTFDLEELESLDFIVAPFNDAPALAHTLLSFGFREGRHLAVSAEVRLEQGESFSPLGGLMRQFEITYVVADERDVIKLRTDVRKADVYIYRTTATPEQTRDVFVDVMRRVNSLKKHPEFYDTLMNNCTTNIVSHINRLHPGRIPVNPTTVLTGYSDRMAYELGLLVDHGSFEATQRHAHINEQAARFGDSPRFSQLIRANQSNTMIADRAKRTVR